MPWGTAGSRLATSARFLLAGAHAFPPGTAHVHPSVEPWAQSILNSTMPSTTIASTAATRLASMYPTLRAPSDEPPACSSTSSAPGASRAVKRKHLCARSSPESPRFRPGSSLAGQRVLRAKAGGADSRRTASTAALAFGSHPRPRLPGAPRAASGAKQPQGAAAQSDQLGDCRSGIGPDRGQLHLWGAQTRFSTCSTST
jgi:hypothetical protein